MPRGLGDDPLSRQRKNGKDRPAASDAPTLNSMAASYDAPSVQSFARENSISEASASSQPSPSYNDVFFQRRLENGLEHPSAMNSGTPSPSVAEPVMQPTEASEIGRASVGTAPADYPRPQGEDDAAPARTSPILGETLIVPKEDAKTGQPKAEARGFFKRIFGRLGGRKSH